MDDRIERPLQERGVDRAHRAVALDGHPAGEHGRVLLGDAHVVGALGEAGHHVLHAGALEHGGGDAHHARVALGLGHQSVAEHLGVGRDRGGGGGLLRRGLAALDDERGRAVHRLAVGLGRRISAPLDRHHVDHARAILVERGAQRAPDALDVVPVDRADVGEAERLEERAGLEPQRLGGVADVPAHARRAGHPREAPLELLAHAREARIGPDALEQLGERPDVLGDAHAVVVEDHRDGRSQGAGLVEPLVRHAAGQGAVADHGDDMALAAPLPLGLGEARGVADRGAGVARAHDVVLALLAAQEAADAAVLAQRAEPVEPPGEQLVAVGLVADVPHDAVARRLQLGVEGDGELHRPEARAEVTAGARDGVDDRLAHLLRQRLELRVAHTVQLVGAGEPGEDRETRIEHGHTPIVMHPPGPRGEAGDYRPAHGAPRALREPGVLERARRSVSCWRSSASTTSAARCRCPSRAPTGSSR